MGLNRKIINSPKSRLALEQKLAKFFGFEYSVVFGRGRSALTALLEVVSKGQELNFVIPSNICPSIVASASTINARIIAVDVEKETGLPSDSAFKKAIMSSKGPGVFMPTYLYGFDRSYKKAISSARNRGWFVLENDCCGTLPACKDYKANSTRGDAVLVSFGGGKPIDAGGGGAVISNNAELIQDLHDELVSYQILDQSFVKME